MTGTLKIPSSTLVKSRQQNVGGSFYRISRHDPCKLFKVIQIDIFRQKLPSKNITSLQCANILETFDHPAEAKIRSCDSLLEIGFEPREGEVRKIREE